MRLYNTNDTDSIANSYTISGCNIGIGNLTIGNINFNSNNTNNINDIEIERPPYPIASPDYLLLIGEMSLEVYERIIEILFEPLPPCGNYTYSLYMNFVGEDEDTFFNGDNNLQVDARNMFSVVTLNGVDKNNATYLFKDTSEYENLYHVGNITSADASIPYDIEIADDYKDLYEIYYVYNRVTKGYHCH